MTEHAPTPKASGTRNDTLETTNEQTPRGATARQRDLLDYGQHAAETRAMAAADALPKAPNRREAIELHVAACGDFGATRQEIAEALELPIQSVCGPVLSLLTLGRLRETEKRRRTQYGKTAAVIVSGLVDDGVAS